MNKNGGFMINRPLYLDRIRPFIGKPIIKVVTGIRRCGKSSLLQLIQLELEAQKVPKSRMLVTNFELFRNRDLKNPSVLHHHVSQFISTSDDPHAMHYLFFDEIQEVELWEKLIPSLQLEFNVDIYLTGSNAHFLSSEFATYLSGRYVEFCIYPFSFEEFTRLRTAKNSQVSIDQAFDSYRILGGFPFLSYLDFEMKPSKEYLLSIYDTVMLKDMIERERIKDSNLLRQLVPFLMANIGHTFSGRSIERMLEGENIAISVGTVLKYVEVACRANLFYRAPREDIMTKKVFKSQEKYYLADHGLREAVYGNNDRNIDQVLENIVYIELLRQGWNVTVGEKVVSKNTSGKEVDFIARKGSKQMFFQVCYLLADESTISREFNSLELLRSDFPKYVLSMDSVDRSQNGITHMNIKEFLLKAKDLLK
jgi:predicted AAA+ superfamily ATPase